MTEPIGCTCHSINSTAAAVNIYICMRQLLWDNCLSFKAFLYYISNLSGCYISMFRSEFLCYIYSYIEIFLFGIKKLMIERATCTLCSSEIKDLGHWYNRASADCWEEDGGDPCEVLWEHHILIEIACYITVDVVLIE